MPFEVVRLDWTDEADFRMEEKSVDVFVTQKEAQTLAEELTSRESRSYEMGDGGVTTPQFIVREVGSFSLKTAE